ncbi:uncharacterized protein LOC123204439 isoform X2 [Mangifera indica]|nr:uncharacterized protein LOC123204439 isoform X2 [Mangifera indica]
MGTAPDVMDNSGMKKLMCTQSLKGGNGAGLGDSIDASVKEAMLNAVQRSLSGGLGNNLSSLFSILNETTARNFLSQDDLGVLHARPAVWDQSTKEVKACQDPLLWQSILPEANWLGNGHSSFQIQHYISFAN